MLHKYIKINRQEPYLSLSSTIFIQNTLYGSSKKTRFLSLSYVRIVKTWDQVNLCVVIFLSLEITMGPLSDFCGKTLEICETDAYRTVFVERYCLSFLLILLQNKI